MAAMAVVLTTTPTVVAGVVVDMQTGKIFCPSPRET